MSSYHEVYKALGIDDASRRALYIALFDNHIPKAELEEIRTATNKAWVLGNDLFKAKIGQLMDRQVQPKPRGGNRRSDSFKKKHSINRG